MDPMKIDDVLKAVGGVAKNISCKEITSVVTDDRAVKKGCAFVALKGERFDGHDFIQSAVEKGASLVITEKEQLLIPQIIVEDTQRALLDLAYLNRSRFSGMVIGVTGSDGKTTTKEMVSRVLGSKMKVLKTDGNLNNEVGVSKTLFGLDSSYGAAVVEMGMCNTGDILVLSQAAKPTLGIITNVGVSHMENFESRDGILKTKLEILEYMPKGSTLIVGGDNDKLKDLILPNHKIVKCGIQNKNCEYYAYNIKTDGSKTEFDIRYGKNVEHVLIPILGNHNVINALFAFAVGIIAKIEPKNIAQALSEYRGIGMRQKVFEVGGATVIADCYNASPESMKAAITSLMTISCSGRRIAVLGDMLELGAISKPAHRELGEIAFGFGVDLIYCYGDEAREIYEGALSCCEQNSAQKICHFKTKEDLIEKLESEVKSGDVVLFKASRRMRFEDIIEAVFNRI